MGVSAFDPHAGKRSEVVEKIHQVGSSTPGCKCSSCGSFEYVNHKGRSICAYCRTPAAGSPSQETADRAGSLSNYLAAYSQIPRKRASYDTSAADYARICASLWSA